MTDKIDPLNQAFADIVTKALSGVDAAASFLSAQIPDVIHQLLVWKMAQAGGGFILCLLFIIGYVFLIKMIVKNGYISGPDLDVLAVLALIIGGIFAVVCVVFAVANLFDMLQIWLAPKIYVMEYASSLIKGS